MLSIGLMSGTSMDGLDVALLDTDGLEYIVEKGHLSCPYSREFQLALKAVEYNVRKHQGNLPEAAKENPILESIIAESTELHAQAVLQLLEKYHLKASDIEVIGYHGQTLYHQPQRQCSVIAGDGQTLANRLHIPVVYQFRANDIAAGGQGAPFAPIYHWALAKRDGFIPCVVLNCGGIANTTLITSDNPEEFIAFDTGPGNGLIDAFVRQKTNGRENKDTDGHYGSKGKVDSHILKELYQHSMQGDKADFFQKAPPKSLDIADFQWPKTLENLSLEDACRTLEAFTADSILQSLINLNRPLPNLWILAGGGWHNPVILEEFETRLHRILPEAQVKTANAIGWNGDALEAQIFAYLAVRHLKQWPFSFPGTTGVPRPLSGGVYCNPISPP